VIQPFTHSPQHLSGFGPGAGGVGLGASIAIDARAALTAAAARAASRSNATGSAESPVRIQMIQFQKDMGYQPFPWSITA
jgi:hypothetical protein